MSEAKMSAFRGRKEAVGAKPHGAPEWGTFGRGRWRNPSIGGARWRSRKRRRKPGPVTKRHQRLQTRAARARWAGSSGGERSRTCSTRSSMPATAAAGSIAAVAAGKGLVSGKWSGGEAKVNETELDWT
nr:unnamed protein product [Digitaria exilis]